MNRVNVQGLTVIGEPEITCFAIGSNDPDVHILAVGDVMESKGNVVVVVVVVVVVAVLLYVHRNRGLIRDGEPRTSTSTFTHSSWALKVTFVRSVILNVFGCPR